MSRSLQPVSLFATFPRWIWLATALLCIGLTIAGIQPRYEQILHIGIAPEGRPDGGVNTSEVQFQALGPLTARYAVIVVGIECLVAIAFFLMAFLIIWHFTKTAFPFFVSLLFLAFGTTIPGMTNALLQPYAMTWWNICIMLLRSLAIAGAALFFFWFPSGRSLALWWQILTIVWIVCCFLWFSQWFITVGFTISHDDFLPFNLLEGKQWERTFPLSLAVTLFFFGNGLGAVILRFRAAKSVEKQQLKWVLFGLLAAVMGALIYHLPIDTPATAHAIGISVWALDTFRVGCGGLGVICVPISITIAIVRYHLWDIDILISLSTVYSLLTVFTIALYILIVSLSSIFLGNVNRSIIAFVATAVIAVSFQPLRLGLQQRINHLLFGERDDPYTIFARLGRLLRETETATVPLQSIVDTIGETLKLPYVQILTWIQGTLSPGPKFGSIRSDHASWDLQYRQEQVGFLVVSPRIPNDIFTPREQQLIGDLANQAGAAVHTMKLYDDLLQTNDELRESRERIIVATENERKRIRDDLHDTFTLFTTIIQDTGTARSLVHRHPQKTVTILQRIETRAQDAYENISRLLDALDPPAIENVSLIKALHTLAEKYEDKLAITLALSPLQVREIGGWKLSIYRIVQESLNNVLKHAKLQKGTEQVTCHISLRVATKSVFLEITDDGSGPFIQRQGRGILAMRERAATLGGRCVVAPRDDEKAGTSVMCEFPRDILQEKGEAGHAIV